MGAYDVRSGDRMARQIRLISSLVAILSIGCSGAGLQVKTSSADVKAGGKVRALFDLHDPSIGPFPSDQFTVADASHITGRRVNLPLPDCAARPTDCEDVGTLNRLDGFNLQPRLTVAFDGAIDPASVTSDSLFLLQVSTGSPPSRIGINQLVWDPGRLVAVPESDQTLDQHSEFVLVGYKRTSPARMRKKFFRAPSSKISSIMARVSTMIAWSPEWPLLSNPGFRSGQVVTASVFTTMSVTSISGKDPQSA